MLVLGQVRVDIFELAFEAKNVEGDDKVEPPIKK